VSSDHPLAGYTVVEVANYIAGPAAGALLADLGARVIHVETVGGDPYRGFRLGISGFGATSGGEDLAFQVDNRGKESIAVDLRDAAGQAVVQRLLERSDVLLTNLSDSQLKKMGLEPEAMKERYPRLVYARLNGYGFRGPEADTESFDLGAFWARGGLLEGMAGAGGLAHPRPGVGDHAAALSLVAGIALSLLTRERTGEAPPARTSLLDTAMWMNALDIAGAAFYGRQPEHREGGGVPLIAAYSTADGRRIYLQATHDAAWQAFCRAVEHPQWMEDERFQGLGRRRKNAEPLRELITAVMETKSLRDWAAIFKEHGVPVAIVNSAFDVFEDEQVVAGGHLRVRRGDEGVVAMVSAPFEVGEPAPAGEPPLAPAHGAQSEALMLELGYEWEAIAALRDRGILGPA
jgi:crotonobetainyl-CoA:carnitine CoA-transferase CaiB-like acyl-CoA transferase